VSVSPFSALQLYILYLYGRDQDAGINPGMVSGQVKVNLRSDRHWAPSLPRAMMHRLTRLFCLLL